MSLPLIHRREFFQLTGLAVSSSILGSLLSCSSTQQSEKKSKGRVVIGLWPTDSDTSCVRLFNWDDHSYEDVIAPIGKIHSVTQDERDKNTLYLFEIFGSCVKFNLITKQFIKIDHHGATQMFNGHGALSDCGEYIACTELDVKLGSVLTLRSSYDLRQVLVAPKECKNVHQVVSMPKTSLMAMGGMRSLDGKSTGAITFYDTKDKKVTNRLEFPFPVLHLMPLSSHEVIGVSHITKWNRTNEGVLSTHKNTSENIDSFSNAQMFEPGPLYYASTSGESKTLWSEKDKNVFYDSFGLAKISSNEFLSGHHGANKVVQWENSEIKKIVTIPRPKNLLVSNDQKELLVLSDERISIYSMDSFELIKKFDEWPKAISFSTYQ